MMRNVLGWCGAGLVAWSARGSTFDTTLAETEADIRVWHTANGLPAEAVTAIIQTRDGYLWVGTSAGLVRFDGDKFTPIKLAAATPNAPVRVTALCEDRAGHVWVGTQQDGLFEWDCTVTRHYTRVNGLLEDSITSLAADEAGAVWIGTKAGLNVSTDKGFRALTTTNGLPDNLVSGVHVARGGAVWITTRSGMSRFLEGRIVPYDFQTDSQGRSPEYLGAFEDRRGNIWAFGDTYLINLAEGKRFNYFRGTEAASVRIWSLCEGHDGRLWIGTSGRGLFCFEDNRFQPVIFGEQRRPYDVRTITEDREGNLWLGTSGGGLVQLRPQSVHIQRVGHGLPDSAPTTLAQDASGRLFVGMQRGGIFVGEAGRFEQLSGGGGLEVQDFVTALAVSPDGTVWAGSLGGGLFGLRKNRGVQFTTANGLADDAVLSLATTTNGAVWVGTRAGTLHRWNGNSVINYDTAAGLTGSSITALLPSGGGLWLGTRDGGLLRETNGHFGITKDSEKLGTHAVVAFYESGPNQLWIGSAGGGLACLLDGVLHVWTKGDGLPDETIAGVAEDAGKNLWLATGTGVFRVAAASVREALENRGSLVCKLISEARTSLEGVTAFGGTRVLSTAEGRLWFATFDGVLSVDTRRREADPTTMPLYIERIVVNNERALTGLACLPPADSKAPPRRMPGDLRSLEFQFTALNFTSPEKVRFRHRLEGSDSDWVNDAGNRSARYGKLPFGQYRFRLAARTAEGPWRELAAPFAFEVPTPLYFQAWAIALYVIAAVALVTTIVRIVSHRRLRTALARLEQQQTLERERMRIARDMHDEIGSKLTKISFLSEHAKVDAAGTGALARKIESIATSSRELLQTMDEIVWVVNPRNDTLEHLAAYLSHYAVEYFQNTSVECDLRLPRAIPHHHLSSEARHNLFLAFEETLNNVLKHSGATKVSVEMILKGLEFEIQVADNGHGFEKKTSPANARGNGGRGGNGLKNMQQRMTDIGGTCEWRTQSGAGTTVILHLKLNAEVAHAT